jgi:two-component sensor histidine kinase
VKERAPEGRFIPLSQIRTADESTRFVTDMIPLLHLPPDQARAIGHVVSELLSNVLEHSGSPHGAILCAQYYRKSNTIRIGIADTGKGIKATINR